MPLPLQLQHRVDCLWTWRVNLTILIDSRWWTCPPGICLIPMFKPPTIVQGCNSAQDGSALLVAITISSGSEFHTLIMPCAKEEAGILGAPPGSFGACQTKFFYSAWTVCHLCWIKCHGLMTNPCGARLSWEMHHFKRNLILFLSYLFWG